MRFLLCSALLAPIALSMPAPAMAQAAGNWRVSGDIDGKSFVVTCRFDQRGAQMGGACTDVSTGTGKARQGKIHALSQGSVQGKELRWSYPVKVMLMSVDIDFTGTLMGTGMIGTVTAKGRRGTFSAVRI